MLNSPQTKPLNIYRSPQLAELLFEGRNKVYGIRDHSPGIWHQKITDEKIYLVTTVVVKEPVVFFIDIIREFYRFLHGLSGLNV